MVYVINFVPIVFFIISVTFFSLCFFLFFLYITLYIWNSKLYSRFLIYTFWYLISILYLYFLYNFMTLFVFACFLSLFFFFFFLTLYFWNSKLYSRFLTLLFGISYQFCTYIFFIIFVTLFVFVCSFFLSFFSFSFSLTLYFWNSKLYSRLLIFGFMYLLPILYL